MSNSFFRFKRFVVNQDRCAMKVGTDGTLLGAWASGGSRILDIGTGTGLIAMMMAQRFPDSSVVAIDIDRSACEQARENVADSPFAGRITVENVPVQDFVGGKFDAVVCNPPFFVDSYGCPDDRRHIARHAESLSFEDLFRCVSGLLDAGGEFSVVIPVESFSRIDSAASMSAFRCVRKCAVKTVPRKAPRRYLLAYAKDGDREFEGSEECIEDEQHQRSAWYSALTSDFYLC